MAIKVAVIEDHKDFRESIFLLIESTVGYECTAAFGSVEESLETDYNADVLLLDVHLPGISGIEGIAKIKEKNPFIKIIMLTIFEDEKNIFDAILAGANGYLLKKTSSLRILQAVEDAYYGGAPMTPFIAQKTLEMFKGQFAPKDSDYDLTKREREVLKLIIEGYSNKLISEKLYISFDTVRNHLKSIYLKLHVHSKSEAVLKTMKEKII
ncbi:MAG: response regulator transcription factor [Melioribacteraceae bacterium]|nr:response regulator transcription factor [Melioribacteraceae bacterium]